MAHLFFIDPLENLNIKKDSSLYMAKTFADYGHEVFLLFPDDLSLVNQGSQKFPLWKGRGKFIGQGPYLQSFEKGEQVLRPLKEGDILHMRLDPPFDGRYLRYLWMLDFLEKRGLQVVNHPRGIAVNNEKLLAYGLKENPPLSFIGSSIPLFEQFCDSLKKLGHQDLILKPLDSFSGKGVKKVSLFEKHLTQIFSEEVARNKGPMIAQPFYEEVFKGELRSIYYNGEELGTIIKKPVEGNFLSNIAQGAKFEKVELPQALSARLEKISWELKEEGILLIAFDILGERISEINITCPGLLVEVAYATGKNLALEIAKSFKVVT